MKTFVSVACFTLLMTLGTNPTLAGNDPPNWKVVAAGTTDGPGDGSGPDVDAFTGHSTHLGRFTGAGQHFLDPESFTFVGTATFTAANGDQLDLEYTGSIFGFDPDPEAVYPFLVEGEFVIVGGTGRLANATGSAQMTGGFTGTFPGNLFFEFEGKLHPQGK